MPARKLVRASLAVVLALPACSSPSDPPDRSVAAVVVRPSSVSFQFVGDERRLEASALDASGDPAESTGSVRWSSSDPGVVAVATDGVATAASVGVARVTAEIDGVEGSASLTVRSIESPEFLLGGWEVSAVQTLSDGSERSWDGVVRTGDVSGGQAFLDRTVLADGDETAPFRSLIGFRASQGTWYVGRVDGVEGAFAVLTGSFQGDGGTFTSDAGLGEADVVRLRFVDVRRDRFESRVERSSDGGATWSPVWSSSYERASDVTVPSVAAAPGCDDPEYRFFDFWIGDWVVRTPGGGSAGTNRVEGVAGGCAVQENYDNGAGVTATSLTGLDGPTGEWIQLYMDSGNNVLELRGGPMGPSLVLHGRRGGIQDRFTWTPRGDGSVRQFWETNGGAGWAPFFEGIYELEG